MKSDTYYFSHDYNARFDEKIKLLIRKHSMLGYGCYWAIIEDLYNNSNALRTDYDGIAFDLRITPEQAKSIINDFELFEFDGDYFGSKSVERRLNERNEKSEKARQSAFNRWNKSKDDANALRTQTDGNAIKENKGNEIKEKESKEDLLLEKVTKDILLNDEPNVLPVKGKPKSLKPTKKELEDAFEKFRHKLLELSKDENLVNDFMLIRQIKKATNSETAFNILLSEIKKANININEALKICISRDWKGFNHEWLQKTDFKPKFEPKEDRRDPVLWKKNILEKLQNNNLQIVEPITPHK